jgi:hypothetical protein
MAVRYVVSLCVTMASLVLSTIALAQEPQQPPPGIYTGNVGGTHNGIRDEVLIR